MCEGKDLHKDITKTNRNTPFQYEGLFSCKASHLSGALWTSPPCQHPPVGSVGIFIHHFIHRVLGFQQTPAHLPLSLLSGGVGHRSGFAPAAFFQSAHQSLIYSLPWDSKGQLKPPLSVSLLSPLWWLSDSLPLSNLPPKWSDFAVLVHLPVLS